MLQHSTKLGCMHNPVSGLKLTRDHTPEASDFSVRPVNSQLDKSGGLVFLSLCRYIQMIFFPGLVWFGLLVSKASLLLGPFPGTLLNAIQSNTKCNISWFHQEPISSIKAWFIWCWWWQDPLSATCGFTWFDLFMFWFWGLNKELNKEWDSYQQPPD